MFSKKQINLKAWIKQNWRTKSGKKSSVTGERYLPEKAIKALYFFANSCAFRADHCPAFVP